MEFLRPPIYCRVRLLVRVEFASWQKKMVKLIWYYIKFCWHPCSFYIFSQSFMHTDEIQSGKWYRKLWMNMTRLSGSFKESWVKFSRPNSASSSTFLIMFDKVEKHEILALYYAHFATLALLRALIYHSFMKIVSNYLPV